MLGLGDTASVASVCKPWEAQSGDGSNASKCSITGASIFDTPRRILGLEAPNTDGVEYFKYVNMAIWAGLGFLAYTMFKGKG